MTATCSRRTVLGRNATPDDGLILDLFAGPGGWSHALRMLGLADVGIELDPAACATRAAAGHATVRADVATLPVAQLRGKLKGLIGSPPCQGMSAAGKRSGWADLELIGSLLIDLAHGRDTRAEHAARVADPRSLLIAEPLRYALAAMPEWIACEQVPAVLPLWKETARHLEAAGYSTWCGILNAADYGVPQTRKRAFLIASRARRMHCPTPTHAQTPDLPDTLFGTGRKPWVTMADALGWGATDRPVPTVTAGGGKTGGAEPFPSQARATLKRSQSSGSWVLRNGNQPNAARRTLDEPAPTMAFGHNSSRVQWTAQHPATTVCGTDRISPPGHRDRAGGESQFSSPSTLRITVAEAALLQSFPADYPWQGTNTKAFEQIGNAVPPRLAAAVLAVAAGIEVGA